MSDGTLTAVRFIGGPFDGQVIDLRRTPSRVEVGERKTPYARVDDPDTGASLDCYVVATH